MNHSVQTLTVTAAAALSANRFVTAVGAVPAAGANVIGVTRTSAGAAGDLVPVDTLGTTMVEASAAITAGAAVETTNDGRAVTLSSGAKAGRALTGASGAGVLFEVFLVPN